MRSSGAALIVVLALCGCRPPHEGSAVPTATAGIAASGFDAGRKIYNFRCSYCHGYSGDARTLASSFLVPPPRDFGGASELSRAAIVAAVREGKPGTAMQAFGEVLTPAEIGAVADFVRAAFIERGVANTRYHTRENGWPDHDRYAAAFPFATGRLPLDAPGESLLPAQVEGRRLYLGACVSCHDRGRVLDEGPAWELRSVSFPPNSDACAGCHTYSRLLHGVPGGGTRIEDPRSPYLLHDAPPATGTLSERARRGERLFRRNCAFCHAADGSGRNWIGAFLEPHPRNLADHDFASAASRHRLVAAIRDGLPGTSMPAWKSVLRESDIEAIVAYVSAAFGPVDR